MLSINYNGKKRNLLVCIIVILLIVRRQYFCCVSNALLYVLVLKFCAVYVCFHILLKVRAQVLKVKKLHKNNASNECLRDITVVCKTCAGPTSIFSYFLPELKR